MTAAADTKPPRPSGAHWYDPRDWLRLLKWQFQVLAWRWRTPAPPTAYQRNGLKFWALVLGGILTLEALAATYTDIGWPTISSMVGHLEDLASWVGVIVVALITAAVFFALSWRSRETSEPPADPLKLGRRGWHYDHWTALGGVAFSVAVLWLVQKSHGEPITKYQLGYALYGSLAFFGIVIPLWLVTFVHKAVNFPNLFATLEFVRTRFKVVGLVLLCGLAVLAIHLALYPWPDLARENVTYAGLKADEARAKAEQTLESFGAQTRLVFTSMARGKNAKQLDAWLVYFNTRDFPADGISGCVVVVRKAAKEEALDQRGKIQTAAAADCHG